MKANNKDIYNSLVENGFFESLLDLIVRYEWNNMLHSQIEKIITFVIDGNNEDLKTAVFFSDNTHFIDYFSSLKKLDFWNLSLEFMLKKKLL